MSGRVGVVGAGLMGGGVAYVVAAAGYGVVLVDHDPARLEAVPDRFRQSWRLQRLAGRGTRPPDVDRLLDVVSTSERLDDMAGVDLVVENVTEDLGVKTALYRRLGDLRPAPAVIAANTSAIPIDLLAAETPHPERVVGMHFMNPVELKPAVEVVRGRRTSPGALEAATGFLRVLGREPVVVGDGPGFVANRVLMAVVNDAARMVAEGVADVPSVDRVFTACLGHPMGPLQTADLIGLDTVVATLRVLHDLTGDDRYAPCGELLGRVERGDLGRKAGAGFYPYRDGGARESGR